MSLKNHVQSRWNDLRSQRVVRNGIAKNNYAENITKIRIEIENKQLKADVKKTTTFVKKIKAVSDENVDAMILDAKKFNLRRYLTEIILVFTDNGVKVKDCFAAARLISCVHQRYEGFADDLIASLEKKFYQNLESSDISSQYFRLLIELVACNINPNIGSCCKYLKKFLMYGIKPNSPGNVYSLKHYKAILSFVRVFSFDFFPSTVYGLEDNHLATHLTTEFKKKVYSICLSYYNFIVNRRDKENILLLKKRLQNKEEILSKGNLSSSSTQYTSDKEQLVSSLVGLTGKFSCFLNKEVPAIKELRISEASKKAQNLSLWDRSIDESKENMMFLYAGEEYRSFYQDLPDIVNFLSVQALSVLQSKKEKPQEEQRARTRIVRQNSASKGLSNSSRGNLDQALDLFGGYKKQSVQQLVQEEIVQPVFVKKKANKKILLLESIEFDSIEEYHSDGDERGPKNDRKNDIEAKRQVLIAKLSLVEKEFLSGLSNCLSKELCDSFSIEYCELYAKSKGKKDFEAALLHYLYYIPGNHYNIIKFYSRIVASLSQLFPEVGKTLIEKLISSFKYISKTRTSSELARIKNAKYLSELIKFKSKNLNELYPIEKIFFLFTFSLKKLNEYNVGYIIELLDNVGKFLFRNKNTVERFSDVLKEIEASLNGLNENERKLLQNAIISCKNVDDKVRSLVVKQKSKVERYIQHLIYSKLNKAEDVLFVLSKILKLNWKNFEDTTELLMKYIFKVHKMRVESIKYLALLIKELGKYYPTFHTILILELCNDFQDSLEATSSNYQKFISRGILFTELFNIRVVSSSCFFDTLYFLISYHHGIDFYGEDVSFSRSEVSNYVPTIESEHDPDTSIYRIILVTEMISQLGSFSKQGTIRKSLEKFWAFLERYAWYKLEKNSENYQLMLTIQTIMNDTLQGMKSLADLPKTYFKKRKSRSFQENTSFQKSEILIRKSLGQRPRSYEEACERIVSLLENKQEEKEEEVEFESLIEEEEEEDEDEEVSSDSEVDSEDFHTSDEEEYFDFEKQAENQFDLELRNLLKFNVDQIKMNQKATGTSTNNMAIPLHILKESSVTSTDDPIAGEEVKFKLLKRDVKGRVETRELFLPEHSAIALASQKDKEEEKEELAKMKEYILKYEERERMNKAKDVSEPIPSINNQLRNSAVDKSPQ